VRKLILRYAIPVLELCSVNETFNYRACLGTAFWKERMPDLVHCFPRLSIPYKIAYISITETKNLPQCYRFYKKD